MPEGDDLADCASRVGALQEGTGAWQKRKQGEVLHAKMLDTLLCNEARCCSP